MRGASQLMRVALRQTFPSWFFFVSAMLAEGLEGEEPSETSAPGQVGAG